jgi:hypothetical protein
MSKHFKYLLILAIQGPRNVALGVNGLGNVAWVIAGEFFSAEHAKDMCKAADCSYKSHH